MVTLPQHEEVNDLSEDIKTHWQRFAARIAVHEQRHVDIYLDGAKAMKTRIETALTKWSPCAQLHTSIRSLWAAEQAEIESAQDRFHAEDDTKIENDRKPLQARIDVNKARLDLAFAGLRRQLDATRAKMDAVKVEIAKSDDSHCSRARPSTTTSSQSITHSPNSTTGLYTAETIFWENATE